MRPTARVRRNPVFRAFAKLCRQYLRWFGNASYKPERNGERWLLSAIDKEPIRTVLDVGANIGAWSLMASEFFPQANIYAFEVVPATARELRKRVASNGRIKCLDFGLAGHTGMLAIRYNPNASTHTTWTEYPHAWEGERIDGPVVRGDEFLAREALSHVDFLKIDVEGAEHLVLQGLEECLRARRVRFVQFEYGRVNILTRFLLKDFYDLFTTYGYIVGKIYPDHIDFRKYELSDEDFLGPNYLACRADDSVRVGLMSRT